MWLYYQSYILSDTNSFLLAFLVLFSLEPQLPSSRQISLPYKDRGDDRGAVVGMVTRRVRYIFLNKNIPNYYDSSVCKTRKWLHLRRDVRPVKVGLKIAIIKKFDRGKVMYECRILRRKLLRKYLAKTYHVYTLARMPLNTTLSIRTKRWDEF